jgi:hypothetical protein
MESWIYQGKEFTSEDIGKYFGFVYMITNLETGVKYIGKKNFYSLRKDTKKSNGKRKKRIRKESDWKNYYSSSDTLKFLVNTKGKEIFKREILLLCYTLGELNYSETKYLFKYDVLESDDYYNDNIIGRYYSKNILKYPSSLINSHLSPRDNS